jgi:hypothetical protein
MDNEGRTWSVRLVSSSHSGQPGSLEFVDLSAAERRRGLFGGRSLDHVSDSDLLALLDASWQQCLLCDQIVAAESDFCGTHRWPAQQPWDMVKTLCTRGGVALTARDVRLLFVSPGDSWVADLAVEQSELLKQVLPAMFAGFFACATDGHAFMPAKAIEMEFGRPLSANFPEANKTFLAFATSYWTLRIATDRAISGLPVLPATLLLSKVENMVASVFFPTPGPVSIPPDAREATQRELLAKHAPSIGIEEFMRGNAILLRDRRPKTAGCAPIVLLGFALGIAEALVHA